jgi:Cu/Ag efflux protein CusF
MRRASAVAGLLLALCACSGRGSAADAVYNVRARVVEASGSGADLRVVVAHEAIAHFKGRDGVVAEMPAMQMAFGVDPKLDPRALKPGSQWELTFAVRWNQEPVLLITAAKPLAADRPHALDPGR